MPLRFRQGTVLLVHVPVALEVVYKPGDLLCLVDGVAYPLEHWENVVGGAVTHSDLPSYFLGVCHSESGLQGVEQISVDISPMSVYEFDVDSNEYEFGEPLRPALNQDGISEWFSNTELISSLPENAIARAMEYQIEPSNKLRVSFASAFCSGSSNKFARLGCRKV